MNCVDNNVTSAFPIADFLVARNRLSPDAVAFVDVTSEREITYRQLHSNVCRAANLLCKLGVKAGDRVIVLCHNCVEFFELLFACAKINAVLVPLNWRQTVGELQPIIDDCEPKLLFFDHETRVLAEGIAKVCPALKSVYLSDHLTAGLITDKYYAPLRDQQTETFASVSHSPNELWYLLYTSGTTGKPKAVMQTYGMAFANYVNSTQALDLISSDATVNYLPLFHTAGINLYTLPVLIAGGTVYVLPKFEEDRLIQLIAAEKITVFLGVPAIYRAIYLHAEFPRLPLQRLRLWSCGGAPVQTEIIETFAQRGALICNGFGMTETGPMTFLMDQAHVLEKLGSIGKPQLMTEVRIIDQEGRPLPQGEAGELCLRGANITPGYWGNAEATAKALDADGWLKTGDIARMDAEGYYYIVDRIKDMYISGGENVYPAEVELVLEQIAEVLEVAVVGIPDSRWGEVGCAFVITKPGADITETTLLNYAKEHLAGYKVPRQVVICEDLPRTAAGKVQKNRLRDQFEERTAK